MTACLHLPNHSTAIPPVPDPLSAPPAKPEPRDFREGRAGFLHSWDMVTAVNGPGTRLTYFLAGCPLRCQYCHNPDTFGQDQAEQVWAEDLIRRIRRYQSSFNLTGGGLTLSGGEPLLQPAFTAGLFREAHRLGVHTCLDTSGFLGALADDQMLADIDLVLLDLKAGDESLYRQVTTQTLAPTLAFGNRLAALHKPVWIRFVLVPGLTDHPDNIRAVALKAAAWPNVARVDVLPFHQMGRHKWAELGLPYQLADTPEATREQVEQAVAIFRSQGLNCPG
ncbi:MAG: pyruvate formate-lyase-activating protein [Oscillospiraceae bacterium]|nr:pyruvate formate-lyase-activating protein [Oscillospiraceae bacterium]MDD4368532.1 pyruvate formate-lyase-activating protein [Oscillospiraceae bacterium]